MEDMQETMAFEICAILVFSHSRILKLGSATDEMRYDYSYPKCILAGLICHD